MSLNRLNRSQHESAKLKILADKRNQVSKYYTNGLHCLTLDKINNTIVLVCRQNDVYLPFPSQTVNLRITVQFSNSIQYG